MFQHHAKEFLRETDLNQTLIYHKGGEKVDLLALVRRKKKANLSFLAEYQVLSTTLIHLIPALSEFTDVTEETFVRDYKSSGKISVSGGIQGGFDKASAGAKAEVHGRQESSAVNFKKKTVDLPTLKKGYRGQKIDTYFMPTLKKGEVLGFVDSIIFNADELRLCGQTAVDVSSQASWGGIFSVLAKGKMTGGKSYTVPAGRVYAYGFNEIKFQDDEIKSTSRSLIVCTDETVEKGKPKPLPCTSLAPVADQDTFTWSGHEMEGGPYELRLESQISLAPETFEADNSTDITIENLQQIQHELQEIEVVLQPLSHLPNATRSALFQRICQVSEEGDAVTVLKRGLDLWCEGLPYDQPQSSSADSVLHLLRIARAVLPEMTDMHFLLKAVNMLISAMDKLPDHVPSMIAKCSPHILSSLNHLVSSIEEHGRARVSLAPPGPLQEGGELHWLTAFLCSTDDTLEDLLELTTVAGETPAVLLLALCVTVRGLHMMQEQQHDA